MFKLVLIAALVACANAYYNHGPVAQEQYYGNYGHAVPAVPLALNSHQGGVYGHGYGYGHVAAAAPAAQTKVIQATYPGSAHKSYSVGHPSGYANSGYAHGALNSGYAHGALSSGYAHGAVNHAAASYVHAAPAVAVHAPIAYNHAAVAPTYSHSQYAVTEGPTNYAAHSRYSLATAPALSYGHQARYSVGHAAPAYAHALPIDHRVQKLAFAPAASHMGYQSHASQSYSW